MPVCCITVPKGTQPAFMPPIRNEYSEKEDNAILAYFEEHRTDKLNAHAYYGEMSKAVCIRLCVFV